jgi:hypothetical protein
VLLIGTALMVSSLNFWLRHMFYIYPLLAIAWGAVMTSLLMALRTRSPLARYSRTAGRVTILVLVICAAVFSALLIARTVQVHEMRSLMADWTTRRTIPTEFEIVSSGPDTSRIRILSPIPLASGGTRRPDSPITNKIETGVVRLELDGKLCNGRRMLISTTGDAAERGFILREDISVALKSKIDYLVFFPVFYYKHHAEMRFAGVELNAVNIPCVKNVSFVTEFKQSDILMNLFAPKEPMDLRSADLFERVLIPGIGYL